MTAPSLFDPAPEPAYCWVCDRTHIPPTTCTTTCQETPND